MSNWTNVVAVRAAGQCVERDRGYRYHAVRTRGATIFSHERAVCGFVPGRRSAGWVTDDDPPPPEGVTCKTCRARLDGKET